MCIVAGIVIGMMSFAFRVSRRISFKAHRPLTFSTYQRRIAKDVIGLMSYTCIVSLVSSSTKVCCASIVAFCLVRRTSRVACSNHDNGTQFIGNRANNGHDKASRASFNG